MNEVKVGSRVAVSEPQSAFVGGVGIVTEASATTKGVDWFHVVFDDKSWGQCPFARDFLIVLHEGE